MTFTITKIISNHSTREFIYKHVFLSSQHDVQFILYNIPSHLSGLDPLALSPVTGHATICLLTLVLCYIHLPQRDWLCITTEQIVCTVCLFTDIMGILFRTILISWYFGEKLLSESNVKASGVWDYLTFRVHPILWRWRMWDFNMADKMPDKWMYK